MPDKIIPIPETVRPIQPKQIHSHARGIVEKLQQAGYEAYLVGGCVRDLLLGHTPKDFDIVTAARPEQIRRLFPSCRLIGRRFRLAHIYFGRDYIEVATFRAPHDNKQRGGQVNEEGRIIHDNVYGTLEEDVWRRDFTINALFYDPVSGHVIDYINGMQDLQQRQLRLIGEPEVRFREDPVRIIRALRFAAKLDFSIAPETDQLIKPMANLLESVAPARLFDELLKLLHGGNGRKTFELLETNGILDYLLPLTVESLDHDQGNRFRNLVIAALTNTDQRIQAGKPVMPAFLIAVLLWEQFQHTTEHFRSEGYAENQAMQIAAGEVLQSQGQSTSVPRRFSNITREIWLLQSRFKQRELRRVNSLFNNTRFRAAYDFLCLRAKAGEPVREDSEWWTHYQEVEPDERHALCKKNKRSRKRSRYNNNSAAERGANV